MVKHDCLLHKITKKKEEKCKIAFLRIFFFLLGAQLIWAIENEIFFFSIK